MRILHVIATIGPRYGGPSQVCAELCQELARRGEQVSIYTTTIDGDGDLEVPLDTPVMNNGVEYRYFAAQWPRSYTLSIGLFRALRRDIRSFDIVHIHSLYLFHTAAASYLCRAYGVPYLIRPHGTLDPFIFRRHRARKRIHELLVEKRAFAGAAAIHFTTVAEMEGAAKTGLFGWPSQAPANGVVVPNAVRIPSASNGHCGDGARAKPAWLSRRSENEKQILFLSRINFKKGLDLLAKAFGAVCRRRQDVRLIVAGPDDDGFGERVRDWFREEGVLEKTVFTGMLGGSDKTAAFATADMFVLPSYDENFAIAAAEAMSYRLPVIITNQVGIWRDVESAQAGVVINCNAQELERAILKLLDDPGSRRAMGENGRRLVETTFTWEAVGSRMIDLYRRIVEERSAPDAGSARISA